MPRPPGRAVIDQQAPPRSQSTPYIVPSNPAQYSNPALQRRHAGAIQQQGDDEHARQRRAAEQRSHSAAINREAIRAQEAARKQAEADQRQQIDAANNDYNLSFRRYADKIGRSTAVNQNTGRYEWLEDEETYGARQDEIRDELKAKKQAERDSEAKAELIANMRRAGVERDRVKESMLSEAAEAKLREEAAEKEQVLENRVRGALKLDINDPIPDGAYDRIRAMDDRPFAELDAIKGQLSAHDSFKPEYQKHEDEYRRSENQLLGIGPSMSPTRAQHEADNTAFDARRQAIEVNRHELEEQAAAVKANYEESVAAIQAGRAAQRSSGMSSPQVANVEATARAAELEAHAKYLAEMADIEDKSLDLNLDIEESNAEGVRLNEQGPATEAPIKVDARATPNVATEITQIQAVRAKQSEKAKAIVSDLQKEIAAERLTPEAANERFQQIVEADDFGTAEIQQAVGSVLERFEKGELTEVEAKAVLQQAGIEKGPAEIIAEHEKRKASAQQGASDAARGMPLAADADPAYVEAYNEVQAKIRPHEDKINRLQKQFELTADLETTTLGEGFSNLWEHGFKGLQMSGDAGATEKNIIAEIRKIADEIGIEDEDALELVLQVASLRAGERLQAVYNNNPAELQGRIGARAGRQLTKVTRDAPKFLKPLQGTDTESLLERESFKWNEEKFGNIDEILAGGDFEKMRKGLHPLFGQLKGAPMAPEAEAKVRALIVKEQNRERFERMARSAYESAFIPKVGTDAVKISDEVFGGILESAGYMTAFAVPGGIFAVAAEAGQAMRHKLLDAHPEMDATTATILGAIKGTFDVLIERSGGVLLGRKTKIGSGLGKKFTVGFVHEYGEEHAQAINEVLVSQVGDLIAPGGMQDEDVANWSEDYVRAWFADKDGNYSSKSFTESQSVITALVVAPLSAFGAGRDFLSQRQARDAAEQLTNPDMGIALGTSEEDAIKIAGIRDPHQRLEAYQAATKDPKTQAAAEARKRVELHVPEQGPIRTAMALGNATRRKDGDLKEFERDYQSSNTKTVARAVNRELIGTGVRVTPDEVKAAQELIGEEAGVTVAFKKEMDALARLEAEAELDAMVQKSLGQPRVDGLRARLAIKKRQIQAIREARQDYALQIATAAGLRKSLIGHEANWTQLLQSLQAEAAARLAADPKAPVDPKIQEATQQLQLANVARAVVKLASGLSVDRLTDAEKAAAKAFRAPGQSEESSTGAFYDKSESPIITDEAIAAVTKAFPVAGPLIRDSEGATLRRLSGESGVPATEQSDGGVGEASPGMDPAATESDGRAGEASPGMDPAATESDGGVGKDTWSAVVAATGTTVEISVPPGTLEDDVRRAILEEHGLSPLTTLQDFRPISKAKAPAEAPPAEAPQVDPATDDAYKKAVKLAVNKTLGEEIQRLKDAGVEVGILRVDSPDGHAAADHRRVYLNPELITARAIKAGLRPDDASEWASRIVSEEIRHYALRKGLLRMFNQQGEPGGSFDKWLGKYLADIWETEFVGTELEAIVRALYTSDSPPRVLGEEGIRMVSQWMAEEKITEEALGWMRKASAEFKDAIKMMVQVLAELVAKPEFKGTRIKKEVERMEQELDSIFGKQPKAKPKAKTPKKPESKPKQSEPARGPPVGRDPDTYQSHKTPAEFKMHFSYENALLRAEGNERSTGRLKREGKAAYEARTGPGLETYHRREIERDLGMDEGMEASLREMLETSYRPTRNPVSAEAVDTYGITLPDGYVQQGDLYVYLGEGAAPAPEAGTKIPVSAVPAETLAEIQKYPDFAEIVAKDVPLTRSDLARYLAFRSSTTKVKKADIARVKKDLSNPTPSEVEAALSGYAADTKGKAESASIVKDALSRQGESSALDELLLKYHDARTSLKIARADRLNPMIGTAGEVRAKKRAVSEAQRKVRKAGDAVAAFVKTDRAGKPQAERGATKPEQMTPEAVVREAVRRVFGDDAPGVTLGDAGKGRRAAFIEGPDGATAIRIDPTRFKSVEDAVETLEHELAHAAYQEEQKAFETVWNALTEESKQALIQDVRTAYSDADVTEEVQVRAMERVRAQLRAAVPRTRFGRFLEAVASAIQKLTGQPSARDLRRITNRVIATGVARLSRSSDLTELQLREALEIEPAKEPPVRDYSIEALKDTFDLPTDEQAVVADAIGQALGARVDGLVKGGTPGEGALQQFAGENANVPQFKRDSLDTAKAMAAAGKSSAEIRAVTGWFPGKYDGKMRWEIPDSGASLNEGSRPKPVDKSSVGAKEFQTPTSSQYVLHDTDPLVTWLKENPQKEVSIGGYALGQVRVFIEPTNSKTTLLGSLLDHPSLYRAYPDMFAVKVSHADVSGASYFSSNDMIELDLTSPEAESLLFHEIQHAIQKREGFSKGGNRQSAKLAGHGAYRQFAGEIEARDVQARAKLTPEQLKAVEPYSSENIAKDDAIVLYQDAALQQDADTARHAALEAKHDAGTITPEETAEAQRMVEEAARGAGYNTTPVYRGDPEPIDVFSYGKTGQRTGAPSARMGFFFTDSKEVGETYLYGDTQRVEDLKTDSERLEKIAQKSRKNSDWAAYNDAYAAYENAALSEENQNNKGHLTTAYIKDGQFLFHDFEGDAFRETSYAELLKQAKAEGKDGAVFENTFDAATEGGGKNQLDPHNIIVVFDPSQIKSAEPFTGVPLDQRFDPKSPSILYQDAPAQAFYSTLSRTIEQKMPRAATPQQIKGIINPEKGSGVKPEEIKWSGIEQAVQSLAVDGKVTKEALLKYLADEGAVRFEEVTLWRGPTPLSREQFDNLPEDEQDRLADATDRTKFAQYTLPGGENYREVVLAMPDNPSVRATNRHEYSVRFLKPKYGSDYLHKIDSWTESERKEYFGLPGGSAVIGGRIQDRGGENTYTSNHFPDVPNYVAHMRTNERTDADGIEGLFIEEIQSDRHQAGRKKGYAEKIDDSEVRRLGEAWRKAKQGVVDGAAKAGWTWSDYVTNNPEGRRLAAIADDAFAAMSAATEGSATRGIPDAPFRTTWPLAMFKRALRDAVASGKGWVGWTPGSVHTGYWGTERIEWAKQPDGSFLINAKSQHGGEAGGIDIEGEANARNLNPQNSATITTEAELVEAIRPSLTEGQNAETLGGKLWKRMQTEGSGVSLPRKEGFEGFYDNMLPKGIQQYVKQFGGKVERGGIEGEHPDGWAIVATDNPTSYFGDAVYHTEADARLAARHGGNPQVGGGWEIREVQESPATPIWRVTITPEMARSVPQGQPLFQDAKGAMEVAETGKIILRGLKSPDFSTAVHELAHAARRNLSEVLDPGEMLTVEKWAGAEKGWTTDAEEKWARAWERYFREGKAPRKDLQAIFEKIAAWMTKIYRTIQDSPIDVEISPEVRAIFDKLAERMEDPTAPAKPKPETTDAKLVALVARDDWAIDSRGIVKKPGFNQAWTDEEFKEIKRAFADAGLTIITTRDNGEYYKSGFRIADNNNGRRRLHKEIARVHQEERDQKKAAAAQKREDEDKALLAAADQDALGWVNQVFGEDFTNAYNKAALADFVSGKTSKFQGAVSPKWLEGVNALNARNGSSVDFDKVKEAYLKRDAAEAAPATSTPAEGLTPELAKELLALPAEARTFPMGDYRKDLRRRVMAALLGRKPKSTEIGAQRVFDELAKRFGKDDEAIQAGLRAIADESKEQAARDDVDTAPAARQSAEAKEPRDMVRGDRFKDAGGIEFEVWKNRQGTIEAHPVVNGKPVVNKDSGVRFSVTDEAKARNPEDRTDFNPAEAVIEAPDVAVPESLVKEEAVPESTKESRPFDATVARAQKKFLMESLTAAIKNAPTERVFDPAVQADRDTYGLIRGGQFEGDKEKAMADLMAKYQIPEIDAFARGFNMKSMVPKGKMAMVELPGTTAGRLELLERALKKAEFEGIQKVEIEIPGDGVFSIINTKEALRAFAKRAEKFPTTQLKAVEPKSMSAKPSAIPALNKKPTSGDAIKAAQLAVSTEDTRETINWIRSEGDKFISTDGRGLLEINHAGPGTADAPAYIHGKKGGKPLTDQEWRIDGARQFPNYKNVIPPDADLVSVFTDLDTGRLWNALQQAKHLLTHEGKKRTELKAVMLVLNPDRTLGFRANAPDVGEQEHNVQDGALGVVALDLERVQNGLRAARLMGHDKISMHGTPGSVSTSPTVWKAPGFKFVLMPTQGLVKESPEVEALMLGAQPPAPEEKPQPDKPKPKTPSQQSLSDQAKALTEDKFGKDPFDQEKASRFQYDELAQLVLQHPDQATEKELASALSVVERRRQRAIHDPKPNKALIDSIVRDAEFLQIKIDADKAPSKAAPPESDAAASTGDSGAELAANRRGRIAGGLKWGDIKDQNITVQAQETVKSKVYPRPDYPAMVDGGMKPIVAHLVKQIYDAISIKPQVSEAATPEQLQLYIDGVNRVMDAAIEWANNPELVGEWAKQQAGGLNYGSRLTLPLNLAYPEGWKESRDEMLIIGGNKPLSALQPGRSEGRKASKEVDKKWPSSQEAWERQGINILEASDFTISEGYSYDYDNDQKIKKFSVASPSHYIKSGLASRAEAEALIAGLKPYLLFGKRETKYTGFDTKEQALEAAREKAKTKRTGKVIDEKGISVQNAKRTGVAHRGEGENITSERLRDTFGFKGVNFGNWLQSKAHTAERQLHLNHAYDSFMDLADVLNLPPKAISLNGTLGLAIGAQGHGGRAAAHFVPGANEINITREEGAGALSHEFGHALDHHFARIAGVAGLEDPFLTEHYGSERWNPDTRKSEPIPSELRPEIRKHFETIVEAMSRRPQTEAEAAEKNEAAKVGSIESLGRWLKAFRSDYESRGVDMEAFKLLEDRVLAGDLGEGTVSIGKHQISPVISEIRDLYKAKTGRVYSIDQVSGLQGAVRFVLYMKSSEVAAETHVPQRVSTDFKSKALEVDHKEKRKYWATKLELFARAFDAYVADKLAEKDARNTYLSTTWLDEMMPAGEERKAINAAFDGLVGEIKTKETDQGTMAYARDLVERTPRHASLEAKHNAGTITAEETAEAQRLVDDAAKAAGYFPHSDFRDSHEAPSNQTATDEEVREGDADASMEQVRRGVHIAPDDYFNPVLGPRYYGYDDKPGMEAFRAIMGKGKTVKVYRAVPLDILGARLENHDWVSPSKTYAVDHGDSRFGEGEYRVVEESVPIENLLWDGNDIREWGKDDGGSRYYKNTANNIKSAEPFTGVPLDQRFDPNSDSLARAGDLVERTPRHAALEAKHDAGTITAKETAEAQRLVDDAAKAAGYDVGPVWHGTDGAFDVFRIPENGAELGLVFFSKKPRSYGRNVYPYYLRGRARVVPDSGRSRARRKVDGRVMFDDGAFADETVTFEGNDTLYVGSPSQIKSAEPFTGVPLSQRFDPNSDSLARAGDLVERDTRHAGDLVSAGTLESGGQSVGAGIYREATQAERLEELSQLRLPKHVEVTITKPLRVVSSGSAYSGVHLADGLASAGILTADQVAAVREVGLPIDAAERVGDDAVRWIAGARTAMRTRTPQPLWRSDFNSYTENLLERIKGGESLAGALAGYYRDAAKVNGHDGMIITDSEGRENRVPFSESQVRPKGELKGYHGSGADFSSFAQAETNGAFGFGVYVAKEPGEAVSHSKLPTGHQKTTPTGHRVVVGSHILMPDGVADYYTSPLSTMEGALTEPEIVSAEKDLGIPRDQWANFDSAFLYEVSIDATEDELIKASAPMSEQSPQVRRALSGIDGVHGRDRYNALSKREGGDKAASEWLRARGIKGLDFGKRMVIVFDPADIQIASKNGESTTSPARAGDLKGYFKAPIEWLRTRGKRATADDLDSESSAEREAAYQFLKEYKEVQDHMPDPERVEEWREAGVGDPRYANPAGPEPEARKDWMAMRMAATEESVVETHEQWSEAARKMLEEDRDGVILGLMEKFSEGAAISPEETKAVQILLPQLSARGYAGDALALEQFYVMSFGDIHAGKKASHSLGARRDPHKTRDQRNLEILTHVIVKPTGRKKAMGEWKPAEKIRKIADLEKQLAAAEAKKARWFERGDNQPDKAAFRKLAQEKKTLEAELAEARARQTSADLDMAYLKEREAEVEDALRRMGMSMNELFNGELLAGLRRSKVIENVLRDNKFTDAEVEAVYMIFAGRKDRPIAKATGVPRLDLPALEAKARKLTEARFTELASRGLKLIDFEDEASVEVLFKDGQAAMAASLEDGVNLSEAEIKQRVAAMMDIWPDRKARQAGVVKKINPRGKPGTKGKGALPHKRFDPSSADHTVAAVRAIQASVDNNVLDMFYEYWIMNILSGPQTQIVNIMGNAFNLAHDRIIQRNLEDAFAAIFDAVFARRGSRFLRPTGYSRKELNAFKAQFGDRPLDEAEQDALDTMVHFSWIPKVLGNTQKRAFAQMMRAYRVEQTLYDGERLADPAEGTDNVKIELYAPAIPDSFRFRKKFPGLVESTIDVAGLSNAEAASKKREAWLQWKQDRDAHYEGARSFGTIGGKPAHEAAWDAVTGKGLQGVAIGKTVRVSGKMLVGMDSYFKVLAGEAYVIENAYLLGRQRVADKLMKEDELGDYIAKQVGTPGSDAWELTVRGDGQLPGKAQELTFTNPFRTWEDGGGGAEGLVKLVMDARNIKLVGPPLRFLLAYHFPFLRTPFRIFQAGLRRTPFGLMGMGVHLVRSGAYKAGPHGLPMIESYGKARFTRDMVDQFIAWTTTALLAGMIEGDGDEDDDKWILFTGSSPFGVESGAERAASIRQAGGPTQLRIGTRNGPNISFDYGRVEPFAVTVTPIIDALRGVKRVSRGKPWTQEAGNVGHYMLAQADDKTFLTGVEKLTDLVNNPEMTIKRLPREILSAIVPNLIRQPLRTTDDFYRDYKHRSAIYDALPFGGLAPSKVDLMGEPMRKQRTPVAQAMELAGVPGTGVDVVDRLLRIFWDVGYEPDVRLEAAEQMLRNWNRDNPMARYNFGPNSTDSYKLKDADGNVQTHMMTDKEWRFYAGIAGKRFADELRSVFGEMHVQAPLEVDKLKAESIRGRVPTEVRNEMFEFGPPPMPPEAPPDLSAIMGWKKR